MSITSLLPHHSRRLIDDGGRHVLNRLVDANVELAARDAELKAVRAELAAARAWLRELQGRTARAAAIAELNWDSGPCHSIYAVLTSAVPIVEGRARVTRNSQRNSR